jgi:hypothetical protein
MSVVQPFRLLETLVQYCSNGSCQQDKPEACQLLHSLLQYLDSAAFAPEAELDADLLKKLLPNGQ